jgi:hypothetical protein
MNPFEILGVVILAAFGLWQLSTAWSRGEVRGRYGAMIRRADESTHFWMIVAVSALFPLMCAALAVVLAWRALSFPDKCRIDQSIDVLECDRTGSCIAGRQIDMTRR